MRIFTQIWDAVLKAFGLNETRGTEAGKRPRVTTDSFFIAMFLLLIAGGLIDAFFFWDSVPVFNMPVAKKVGVLDAGHGAWDPGKISGKIEEKDINLAIVQKLQAYLEEGGATVIVTRLDDTSLGDSKAVDMRVRSLIANKSSADIFVSIHQNSFVNAGVHGAQVFYFNQSDDSEKLGDCIQTQLKEFADPTNKFLPKPNANYYVLKQTAMPAVIVECGFLSNSSDRKKLSTDEYQEKVAWGVYLGIVDYFNGMEE
jgi:N-acetylmuramoyl-L-alanine amidase